MAVDGSEPVAVLAVETATPELLDLLDPDRKARLLINGERAAALSLANLREAADPASPVLIERSDWLDNDAAVSIADPGNPSPKVSPSKKKRIAERWAPGSALSSLA